MSRWEEKGGIGIIGGIMTAGLWRMVGLRWRDRDSFFFGIIFFSGLWNVPTCTSIESLNPFVPKVQKIKICYL